MGINANVSGGQQITASVGETKIDVAVSGGVGPTGAGGAAATITVGTVTTGAPGSSASVVNAGSSSAAVLNFTIPAGATGATGPQGATGPAGTTTWAGITDKPATFPPSSHQHVAADISDFTSAVVAAAPPTTNASLLTSGTISEQRIPNTIARTSDVSSAVAAVVNAAPAALDTLNELAAALGNDASFAATVTNSLAGKASLVHTHTVSSITDAGTAATRNVPATGNASSSEVVLGSDTRLSDARTPLTHTHVASQITNFAVAAAAVAPVQSVAGRTGAVTLAVADVSGAVASSDSRLTDARTPTAHKSTHATGGTDALTPADIGASAVGHTHTAIQISDFSSAVAAASPEEVVEFLTPADFPATGNASLLYIATDNARAYRWVGSQYAEVGPTSLFMQGHTHAASEIVSGTIDFARLPVGQTSTTVAAGNDARFTDARTPTTHSTTHNPGGSDPVTLVEVYEFTRTTRPAAATGSNGSYTFTIPAAAKAVEFFAIGAGGGGGSGRRGAAGSARFGGGGGGSGGVMLITRTVAELASRTVSMIIGAGGAGGAGRTTDNTDGNNGSNGVDTALTISGVVMYASRGAGGSGGTASTGTGGAGGAAMFGGNAGANSSATGVPGGSNVLGNAGYSAGGGGAGGGISTGDVSYGGAIGRAQGWFVGGTNVNSNGGTAPGGNGQNASDVFTQAFGAQPGGAGAGGAAGNSTTAGGNGGNGANYGGAGGGGGASFNGFNSGAGGNGGDGFVRITVWY